MRIVTFNELAWVSAYLVVGLLITLCRLVWEKDDIAKKVDGFKSETYADLGWHFKESAVLRLFCYCNTLFWPVFLVSRVIRILRGR